jgi:hypothetical protein
MSSVTVFVGLDYHQSGVQVCAMNASGITLANRKCEINWQIVAAAVRPYGQQVHAAIEACSGAASLADDLVPRASKYPPAEPEALWGEPLEAVCC